MYLWPNEASTGFWLDRYWGTVMPGPTNIVADNEALYGLGRNADGLFLSITSLETLRPLPPLSLAGGSFGSDHQTVRSQTGAVIARGKYMVTGRGAAWDGNDGIVTLGDAGIQWLRSEGPTKTSLESDFIGDIVEVAQSQRGPVVGVKPFDGSDTTRWFDVETGVETDPPGSARTLDGQTFTAQGRTATIDLPDWSNVERGEAGEPLLPYDLPELAVTSQDGTELLRMFVGTNDRPYVQIHDFDGRRLILASMPLEPASPPQTVWIIDLECNDCTREFRTGGPFWFDLIGTAETTGDVVRPILENEPTQWWPSP